MGREIERKISGGGVRLSLIRGMRIKEGSLSVVIIFLMNTRKGGEGNQDLNRRNVKEYRAVKKSVDIWVKRPTMYKG